jgi:hypothetical protein
MSVGCQGDGVTTGPEPAPAGAAPGLVRGCARVTGAGTGRSCYGTGMRNAITAACFVKLTGVSPNRFAPSGPAAPEGDVGMVEGDLLIAASRGQAGGGAASRASAATGTSGALPARNRPVKVSRGDGSPGRSPVGSASRRYGGVDRIFLVQHPVFPEPALLDVLPAWPLAEAGKSRYSFRWQGTGTFSRRRPCCRRAPHQARRCSPARCGCPRPHG